MAANKDKKGGAVATAGPRTLKDWLQSEELKRQVALAAPRVVTPDRFMRVALTTFNRTPKLAECTQESVFGCLLDCAALGIEPDGRRAHLIPYRDKKKGVTVCTLIIDYKGLIELGRRSGEISVWRAELVCENDAFEYDRGRVTHHKIDFRKPRGDAYAVYSFVRFKDGAEDYEVLSIEEVRAIRKRSKAANAGPWVTDFNEMAKKTALRRHAKRLTLSPEFHEAEARDFDRLESLDVSAYAQLGESVPQPQRLSERTVEPEPDADAPEEEVQEAPAREAQDLSRFPDLQEFADMPEKGQVASILKLAEAKGVTVKGNVKDMTPAVRAERYDELLAYPTQEEVGV